MIAILHPLILILYLRSSIISIRLFSSAACQSIAGPTHQRTNADDAEEQLVDGNLMCRSHLAKRARQQQVKEKPAQARKSEEAEQTIAKKRR